MALSLGPHITPGRPLLSSQLSSHGCLWCSWHAGICPSFPSWIPTHPPAETFPDHPLLHFSSPALSTIWHVFSLFIGLQPLCHENINSVDPCLFGPLMDPQSLTLSGHLMNISLVTGSPLVLWFILIFSLYYQESGLRNSTSLDSSISPALCAFSVEWRNSYPVYPSSPNTMCIARIFFKDY